MGLRSFLTRLAVFRWWLAHPKAFTFKLFRALREKKALPSYRQWLQGRTPASRSVPTGRAPLTVAMAVSRVPEDVLREAIGSVQRQIHPDFEFLILDDASPEPHVHRVLQEAQREDHRIRLLRNTSRAGISEASNQLVREARGEYVLFLDHDDTLPSYALAVVAASIAQNPEVDWFFSDEDKLNSGGLPVQPCFKGGFSAHLALGWNFMAHLRVIRRETILALGGHRPQREGAQDWDLALRFLTGGCRFAHIPEVLYHWRKVPGSMAEGSPAKHFANRAAQEAIAESLQALVPGADGEVTPLVPGASQFAVRWQAPPDVGVTLLAIGGQPQFTWSRPHQCLAVPDPTDPEAISWSLDQAQYETVAVLPPGGLATKFLETLLARLFLPGTAAAGGCCKRRGRVRASGFLVTRSQAWRDPLAGLSENDPGYGNLAWLPQPRTVLLPWGFVAWREKLRYAWQLAAELPSPWRLTLGLAKAGGEQVLIPEVGFGPLPPPLPEAMPTLPPGGYVWREELDLFRLWPQEPGPIRMRVEGL